MSVVIGLVLRNVRGESLHAATTRQGMICFLPYINDVRGALYHCCYLYRISSVFTKMHLPQST